MYDYDSEYGYTQGHCSQYGCFIKGEGGAAFFGLTLVAIFDPQKEIQFNQGLS